ncbi:MAG: PD-(D/E)XK motif protein [Desulfurivibrio sp.]|nr:PD-(D/E)XK motif protein [Desulfurivibrio sp.]
MSNPWRDIKIPLSSYNVRRADAEHPYEFFWGRDISGDYLFLYQCDAEVRFPEKIPKLKGVDIVLPVVGDNELTRLILCVNNRDDWDIFHSLCLDLLKATIECSSDESVVAVIMRRLERWHLFLKTNRARILSELEQKGLIGELLFLKDYLLPRYKVSEALSFWQGPLDAPQDFCIGETAVEVKCQLGTSKPLIRISSIGQLHTQLERIYLFVVTVGKSSQVADNVINLPIIINEIRESIQNTQPSAADIFEVLLLKAGFMDLDEYDGYSFVVSRCRFYKVTDDFPRLFPDNIPEGIANVTMDIVLEKCSKLIIEPEALQLN